MVLTRESIEMLELEKLRAELAKQTEKMTDEEIVRYYNAESRKATEELGLNLPQAMKAVSR